jgi:hypothetical protein
MTQANGYSSPFCYFSESQSTIFFDKFFYLDNKVSFLEGDGWPDLTVICWSYSALKTFVPLIGCHFTQNLISVGLHNILWICAAAFASLKQNFAQILLYFMGAISKHDRIKTCNNTNGCNTSHELLGTNCYLLVTFKVTRHPMRINMCFTSFTGGTPHGHSGNFLNKLHKMLYNAWI